MNDRLRLKVAIMAICFVSLISKGIVLERLTHKNDLLDVYPSFNIQNVDIKKTELEESLKMIMDKAALSKYFKNFSIQFVKTNYCKEPIIIVIDLRSVFENKEKPIGLYCSDHQQYFFIKEDSNRLWEKYFSYSGSEESVELRQIIVSDSVYIMEPDVSFVCVAKIEGNLCKILYCEIDGKIDGKIDEAATTTEGTQPYKYSTKELDRENGLDLYDSKTRMYDPTIGRTPTQDPMAEKYYSLSPYAWCAGNPITFADPNGKEVDVIWLLRIDQSCNTNYSQQFISELNSITGLSLYIDKEGKLKYNIKETGEVEIKATNKGQGSQTARNHLKSLIDNKETVTVEGGKDSCTRRNTVALNLRQIASFVNGSNNVSNLTLGLGMVFLHESFHTEAGGGLHDDGSPFCTGSVVDKMNTIRDEMNKNGYDFGKRMSYPSILLPNGQNVIPFDNKSFELLRQGFPPTPSSKFISF